MRKILPAILLIAGFAAAAAAATPEKPKNHGYAVTGTVTRVDAAAKTFVVKTSAGHETSLTRTAATKVNGEGLKTGDRVSVRYLEHDGKKVATSIRVEPPAVASATPAAPTSTPTTR